MNVPQQLQNAWNFIKELKLDQAKQELDATVPYAFEHPELLGGLKSITFWKERCEIMKDLSEPLVQTEYFLNQWQIYLEFAKKMQIQSENCLYSFKFYVFSTLLSILQHEIEKTNTTEPILFLKAGICHKSLGNYLESKSYLEIASSQLQENPELLFHLADVYALLDESIRAKVLFREAFYIDPRKADPFLLESELFQRIFHYVMEKFNNVPQCLDWLPVYGVIMGILTVKRELRAVEYGKLRQSIYSLERELSHEPSKRKIIEPLLLFKYFWLIDHFVTTDEGQAKIDEVLLKIKSLNPDIHQLYTK